jgi:PAP_fibrillin
MKAFRLALLAALHVAANAFIINHNIPVWSTKVISSSRVASTTDDSAPSDVEDDANIESSSSSSSSQDEEPSDVESEMSVQAAGKVFETFVDPDINSLQKLLEIGARTGRGEFASSEEKKSAMALVAALESSSSLAKFMWQDKVYGRWELVYSSTELFRSSPFFMAGRAVCSTDDQAKQYNWFCEMHRKALAISTIGAVRQIVSPNRLVSEFEVKAGAVPFLSNFSPFSYSGGLPVAIEGAIVSSADITITDEGDAWELFMDTVEIKGSNLPGLRQLLDGGVKLQSRQLGGFLESNLPSYKNPKPVFDLTYLDDRIRINRDQDNNIFVYAKVSDNMDPTDYSGVMPDLGVTRLLEGFNDSVTKLYL